MDPIVHHIENTEENDYDGTIGRNIKQSLFMADHGAYSQYNFNYFSFYQEIMISVYFDDFMVPTIR